MRVTLHDRPVGKIRRIKTYSRPDMLAKLDGRTREAALMRAIRESLVDHVGGRPSTVQALLIERAAVLALKCAQIDAKILSGEHMTRHDNEHGLAWLNAYRRTLVALGIEPAIGASILSSATYCP
jgi:hypothetical protein